MAFNIYGLSWPQDVPTRKHLSFSALYIKAVDKHQLFTRATPDRTSRTNPDQSASLKLSPTEVEKSWCNSVHFELNSGGR